MTSDLDVQRSTSHTIMWQLVALMLAAATLVLAPTVAPTPAGAATGISGNGLTAETAGPSCWGIKQDHPTSASGVYFLYLPTLGTPQEFYCDMTTDGGGWVLVGRGRDNWTFQPNGQGHPYSVYSNPLGFFPAALSSEKIDQLLGGTSVADLPDGVRIRRAANSTGTSWQEMRFDLTGSVDRWSWAFGGGLEADTAKIDNKSYGPTNTADTAGSWYDLPSSLAGHNDQRRMITKLWSTFAWRMGFAYGSAICGATTSSTNYLYDARGNGCYAMPFTQIWLRPKIGEGDVAYTPLGTTALPAATNKARLSNKPIPGVWGVSGIAPFEYWNRHEVEVWAFTEIGNTIYVGGKFAEVVQGPSGSPIEQRYLAAFNRDTGAWISSFRPSVEGPVYDLAATPDGRLIVGGEFRNINGVAGTSALAVLDPATGAVDPTWISSLKMINSSTRPLVNDIDVDGNWVYVVGDFDLAQRKNGQPDFRLWRLGRFSATTGEVDWNWRPKSDFETISVDSVADRVFFAGRFSAINTSPNTKVLAAVDKVTGLTIGGLQQQQASTTNGQIYQQAVQRTVDAGRVWVGGSEHDLQMLAPSDHALIYSHITKPGGDFQLITEVDGVIYASCHCNQWNYSGTNTWPDPSNYDRVEKANYLMAFDRNTGKIDTRFFPDFAVGSYYEGPWEMFEDSRGCAWVGGDLARGAWNGSSFDWLGGFGVLCPTDIIAPPTPTGFSAVASGTNNVLGWQQVTDNTGAAVEYEVWKDDRVIRKQAGLFWTDTNVTGAHTYAVRAADAAGNRSATTIPVKILPPGPTGVSILGATSVWSYLDTATDLPAGWPIPSTNAWATGTGHFGFGDGDEDTVIGGTALVQYFATNFTVSGSNANVPLKVLVQRDDGIAVNIDGVEFFRDNLPTGPITGATAASSYKWGAAESEWLEVIIPGLAEGPHTISASVHQGHAGNSDGSFGARVEVTTPPGTASAPTAPVVTVGSLSETTATINWTASSDDSAIIGYSVAVTNAATAATTIRWAAPTATSITVAGLNPATNHTVVVTAVDNDSLRTPSASVAFSTVGNPVSMPFGSVWKHNYGNGDPGPGWATVGFNDSAWLSGPGQLGFGDGDEATIIGSSGSLVAYFRSTFQVADPAALSEIVAHIIRDDGVVLYVNGVEIGRDNMPTGPVNHGTYAASDQYGAQESTPIVLSIPTSALVVGTNTLAVSVHQNWTGSADVSFDMQLSEVNA